MIGFIIFSLSFHCGFLSFLAGIPHVPEIPIGTSNSPGSVTLILCTSASSRMSSQMFLFIVNFTRTSNSMEGSRTLEASDYVDGQDHQFIIDGLMEGEQYLFSAQARNQFGSSAFSGNSDLITTATGMLCACALCNVPCVCVCVWCADGLMEAEQYVLSAQAQNELFFRLLSMGILTSSKLQVQVSDGSVCIYRYVIQFAHYTGDIAMYFSS